MSAPDSRTYRLHGQADRLYACRAVKEAPDGWVVTVRPPTRSLQANAMLHAALSDIANQVEWHGKRLSLDVWKRLCTAAWLREIGKSPEMVPALDGKGFDVIFEKTSRMTVKQMASLIDWVQCFAAQHGVRLQEPAR